MTDTVSTKFKVDPPFIFLPSYLLAEEIEAAGEVVEGKALGMIFLNFYSSITYTTPNYEDFLILG